MYSQANHLSPVQDQSASSSVERKSDITLTIYEIPAKPYCRKIEKAVAVFLPLLAVLTAVISQSLSAVLALVIVLLGLSVAITRGIHTEINLSERSVRKIWTTLLCVWHSIYSLDDYKTVEIKDKGRVIEGYQLPYFFVELAGQSKRIKVYSTCDFEDAKAVQEEVEDFLKKPPYQRSEGNKLS